MRAEWCMELAEPRRHTGRTVRRIMALCAAVAVGTAARAEDLSTALKPLVDAHAGQVSVMVKHLATGETFRHRAGEAMPTASLIKLPVMIEAYQQAAEGKLELSERVTLRESDKVPGSGILTTHFSDGTTFSLRDAVRLMIVFSDNTATNLVLDRIGIGATAARMEEWGYPNTKIHSKVYRRDTSLFPQRSVQFGLGSTTAEEMIAILEELHQGERISPSARGEMMEHLKRCEDREKFCRFLPAETVLAHKTGSLERVRTSAGIMYLPTGAVALCVLTSENEDRSWRPDNAGNLLCAKVARAAWDYFSQSREP